MRGRLNPTIAAILVCCALPSQAQTVVADLKAAAAAQGWKGDIAAIQSSEKDGAPAIECNRGGQNIVWVDGLDFADGVIEFDAKGRSAPAQGSFVGVAFRVKDKADFDAVYFRPFNFGAADQQRRAHAVQYISEPSWPWEKLRAEKTGQFESAIVPAPDGDAWFRVRLVIDQRKVRVFVNGADQPSLSVSELSDRRGGSVGFVCIGYGAIANLRIESKD